MPYPTIPETITVHLGRPDEAAENVTVPFTEYIKNVASSEIYPTWPENSLRANILAQVSFTLNRVYTEYYRSRGYDFDVTNTTQFDHAFVKNREIFENISLIVDDIFNDYIVRQGSIEPLFAQFCDGVRTQCDGLSQWGSVELANKGYIPYEILQYYYGDNINIVFDAPVGDDIPSYPGASLRLGSFGEDVRTIQRQLNRIAKNYPAIPVITDINGIYEVQTENAVREFQRIFNLTADGIVGKATWYKIKEIFNGVKRISELTSEGISISEVEREFPEVLRRGDSGVGVRTLRYYLAFLGFFFDDLPPLTIGDVFDGDTEKSVIAFQTKYGLNPDGIVGRETWNAIQRAYNSTVADLPADYRQYAMEIYPGRFLVEGDSSDAVRVLQENLNVISQNNPSVPAVAVSGTYDRQTADSVRAYQRFLGEEETGVVGPILWSNIITAGSGF